MKMEWSRQHDTTGGALKTAASLETQTNMQGVVLPGDSTTKLLSFAVPEPGWGQVFLRM